VTSPADLKFALTKAPHIVEHIIANLRTGLPPHADRLHAPAVLVVGAGPTLDLDRVKAAAAAGVSIWTVNTAAKAVCSVVAPDVVVVRESLDVADHLDDLHHKPRHIVADLSVHPNVWRKADAFFVPASPHTFAIAAMLDVAPVYAGTASLTAAVALAEGASWIGLEGVDLAYGRDGAGYASGARYEARIERVDGTLATLAGGDAQRELALRSGQEPPPMRADVHLVHAREGGPLHASGPWLSQIEWLEQFAARRPGRYLRRGLGLAELVGWGQETRSWCGIYDDVARLPGGVDGRDGPLRRDRWFQAHVKQPHPTRVSAVLADVARQCENARAVADVVSAGDDPTLIADLLEGSVLVDTHAAGRVMLTEGMSGSVVKRARAICDAYRDSAERLSRS
jgi:hypothetical protein